MSGRRQVKRPTTVIARNARGCRACRADAHGASAHPGLGPARRPVAPRQAGSWCGQHLPVEALEESDRAPIRPEGWHDTAGEERHLIDAECTPNEHAGLPAGLLTL